MIKDQTLFDKALDNLEITQMILRVFDDDESKINYAGYHLQQAAELYIKHNLEINGVEYPKSHRIEELMSLCKKNNVNYIGFEYFDDRAEMFTSWESQTRYIKNFLLQKEKVLKATDSLLKIFDEYQRKPLSQVIANFENSKVPSNNNLGHSHFKEKDDR